MKRFLFFTFGISFVAFSLWVCYQTVVHMGKGETEHDQFEKWSQHHPSEGDDAETAKRLTHEHAKP